MVLATGTEARGFQGAHRAVFKLHDRLERIVHVDLACALALRQRSLGNKGPAQGHHRFRLAYQEAPQVDDVRPQVPESAAASQALVEPPGELETGIEQPLLQVERAEVVYVAQVPVLDQIVCLAD